MKSAETDIQRGQYSYVDLENIDVSASDWAPGAGRFPSFRGILLGGTGDISILTLEGRTVIISGLAVGVFHPIAGYGVNMTGTTATDICVGF